MNQEQRDNLFGKEPQYSEHKAGETICFTEDGQVKSGTILHVMPPGEVDGVSHGILYVVNTGKERGFPSMVSPGEVVL